MTIYTRLSRLSKRNAYLVAKHGGNLEALIEELQDHAVRLPFDVRTAPFELMKERYFTISGFANAVACKFPYGRRSGLPSFFGTPLVFTPEGGEVEVLLKRRTGHGSAAQDVYHTVRLPECLFSGRVGDITSWARKTLRAAMQAQREAEVQKLTAQAKDARAQRERLDRDIESAERELAVIADARTRRAERKARSHAARAEYAARNAK